MDLERETTRRVTRRIIGLLFIIFIFNQLDRVNLAFATLQMNAQLGFTPEIYGIGVGVFFFSYLLFEIPSNVIALRVGARIWLARIIISWGVVAMLMAFIYDARSFYALRFLLGLAEAGFVPGFMYYVRFWVPEKSRARILAMVALAIPLSAIINAPIAGLLLSLDKFGGLSGWQWLFLLEGVPSVILGFVTLKMLTERPEQANWLTLAQRNWLTTEIAREQTSIGQHGLSSFRAALANSRVWLIAISFFCATMSTWGLTYWLPQIIKQLSGLTNLEVSLLTGVPFIGLACGMYWNGRHSDKTGDRHWHFAIATFVATAGLSLAAAATAPLLSFIGLVLCATGLGAALGVLWPIPMAFLTGAAAAGGLALINLVGNTAGLVSPYLIGWIRQSTGSFAPGLWVLAVLMFASGLLMLASRPRAPKLGAAQTSMPR
jgi:MFS transporter, ACS family, tartrate transporter